MASGNGAKQRLRKRGRLLWALECTDPMIAEELGCSKSMVCMWRKLHGLPAHAPTGSEMWRLSQHRMDEARKVLRLHTAGRTDKEIATSLNISHPAATKRRRRLGLSRNRPNFTREGAPRRAQKKDGMTAYSKDELTTRKHAYPVRTD